MTSVDSHPMTQSPNRFIWCLGCDLLLSHPPSSVTIQCPKCNTIMDTNSSNNKPTSTQESQLPYRYGQQSDQFARNTPPQSRRPHRQPSDHRSPISNSKTSIIAQFVQAPENPPEFYTSLQDDVVNNLSRKSRSRKREPSVPKRASNAYMLFCKEQRPILRRNQPDLPFATIGATLGNMWRQLSYENRRPYEARASKDRERYKTQMVQYTTNAMRNNFPKYGIPPVNASSSNPPLLSSTLSDSHNGYSTSLLANSNNKPAYTSRNLNISVTTQSMMTDHSRTPPISIESYSSNEPIQRFDPNFYMNPGVPASSFHPYPPVQSNLSLAYSIPVNPPLSVPGAEHLFPMGVVKSSDPIPELNDFQYLSKELNEYNQYPNDYFTFSPPSKYRHPNIRPS